MKPYLPVRTLSFLSAICVPVSWPLPAAWAQRTARGVIAGSIVDGTGARVPGATLQLRRSGQHGSEVLQEQRSDGNGLFRLEVPEGSYSLSVEAPGFATFHSRVLDLRKAGTLTLPVHLVLATLQQEVTALQERDDATDPDSVAGAITLEGSDLDLLSSNSTTLKQQLSSLTGGVGTPRFLVDGFSGGNLPPKASIRSIRIGQNAFSAYYSEYGVNRVVVDTKPGADKLHGQLSFSGTNQPLDARNPYAPIAAPFYDFQSDANLNGPLTRKTSYFVSETVEQLANNAVVNATDPTQPSSQLSSTLPNPQLTQTYSLRLDHQFTLHHFGYLRNEWSQNRIQNSGIQPLVLPEAAFSNNTESERLQIADTQVLGTHAVNEARFQYLRTRLSQNPNSRLPSVLVQGAFQAGGNPGQSSQDNQDAYEAQDRLEFDRGAHSVRLGFRLRSVRDANRSDAGFAGQYIFPDVLSFQRGIASQFSQTTGQQSTVLLNSDVGIYAEDDWKVSRRFTLSYGLRFESQTALPDGTDVAPRVSFAWAIGPKKTNTPIVTLRGGYGIFYNRFPLTQLVQSVRQDGQHQVAHLIQNVSFNPNGPPPGVVFDATQPTIYQVSPRYKSPYSQVATLSLLRSMKRYGTLAGRFEYMHESHTLLTRNVNAPLPGTVDPDDPASGVRPLGASNIYQFSSDANGNLERFYLNYRLALGPRIFAFGIAGADKHRNESDGIATFPADQYNVRLDYARTSTDNARYYTGGFNFQLPFHILAESFIAAHSGLPFNITTGTDLNGDTIYNDRPAQAGQTVSSTTVQTRYGNFDVRPSSTVGLVGRNSVVAPEFVWVQQRVTREIHLGPLPAATAADASGQPAQTPERPWVLSLAVEVNNLTNRNNPGSPIGVISAQPCGSANTAPCTCAQGGAGNCVLAPSLLFGRSLSLLNAFSPITASNRTVVLQTSFTW